MLENNAVLSCVNNEQINEPVLESNVYMCCAIARRRLSDATRWEIIGMSNAGLSGREIFRRLGYSQSVICRLLNKFRKTNHVQDNALSGRPRKTSRRENGALLRLVRRFPFLTSTVVKLLWSKDGCQTGHCQQEQFLICSGLLVIVLVGLSDGQCLLRDRRQRVCTGASNAGTGISGLGEKFTGRMKVGFFSIWWIAVCVFGCNEILLILKGTSRKLFLSAEAQ